MFPKSIFINHILLANDDIIGKFTDITDQDFICVAQKNGDLKKIIGSSYDQKSQDEIVEFERKIFGE
jgi:hypothetical protein